MATRTSSSLRLIPPASWGGRQAKMQNVHAWERVCSRCGRRGLNEVKTIAGDMFRCPYCLQLQF